MTDTITITLAGEERTLKPTLEACQELSRAYQGLQNLVAHLRMLDFQAVVDTIGAGLSANASQRAKLIPSLVYGAGSSTLAASCIDFVTLLLRGGRAEPVEEAEADPLPNSEASDA